MATRVGVGHSNSADSQAAGVDAAGMAMRQCGAGAADIVLLFSTSRHDPRALREGVRSVVGAGARLYGGYGVGIITHEALAYDGHEVACAVIASDTLRLDAFIETGLPKNEAAVGEALGRAVAAAGLPADAGYVLLYDTVNPVPEHPSLNMATPLIAGMSRHVGAWPAVVGMGMIGDMQLHPSYQWFEDRLETGAAMLLAFSGVRMETTVLHGCRPAGRYYTVTRAENQVVLEIDNRPALDVIGEMLGPAAGLSWDDYAFFVTLGVNKGDPFAPFQEENYANRLCIGVDAERKGLVMFENDLVPGTKVQLMRRAVDMQYAADRTRELMERATAGGRRAVMAFFIDCAGRAANFCGLDEEEADYVRGAIPKEVPLLGVYSGVEVAKIGGQVQALDWTGVLCVLTE